MAMPAENGKVTVRVDAQTRERLEAEAQAERRPVAAMAKLLIEDALSRRAAMAQSTMSLHLDAVRAAQGDRQNAMAVPGLTQAAAKAADIAYFQAVVASAMANSISPSAALDALRSLGGALPPLPSVAPHLTLEQMPHFSPPAEPQTDGD